MYVTGGAHPVQGAAAGQGSQHGDGPATIGDLDGLAGFDESQQLTGSLPQFPHAYAGHVLFVALSEIAVELTGGEGPDDSQTPRPRQ